MQAGGLETGVKSIHQDVRKMKQSPGNKRCQHHENKDVFFSPFFINICFQLDLDHHGSVGDENDQEDEDVGI